MNNTAPASINTKQLLSTARKKIEKGNLAEAEKACRRVLEAEPQNHDALHFMGVIAMRAKLYPQAAEFISRALEVLPDFPQALNSLGSVMLAIGKAEQAEKLFEVTLKYKPGYPEAMANLGGLWNVMERFEDAEGMLVEAVKKAPRSTEAHTNLGNTYLGQERYEKALKEFQYALRLDPSNVTSAAMAGHAKIMLGGHREAASLFAHAIEKDPMCVPALSGLSQAKKIKRDDREVKLFERANKHLEQMTFKDRTDFMFAYGKVYQDLGEYGKAFECLEQANAMRRQLRPYNRERRMRFADHLPRRYPPVLFETCGGRGLDSEQPVFIVGMPRSGTTLTEQVLSSHPDVYGAGELSLLSRFANPNKTVVKAGEAEDLAEMLTEAYLQEMGQAYLDGLFAEQPEARRAKRITDKMPGNFWLVGMIKLVFPNAKVIHVRRNPVDTCLSCFQVNFARGHAYSNDLADLGEYYGAYRRVMEHWRTVLPGFMFELDYETLVSDPEETTRRMVEYVGLDWHDACLNPTKNRRVVKTASHWQVRQAVHTGSVERWRRYEAHLGPLLEALQANGVDAG